MSVNREEEKEDVVHIYSETLLRHQNEHNQVICRDGDGLEGVI